GYERDKDILEIFDLAEEVKVSKTGLKKVLGRKLAARVLKTWHEDFVDEDTGEVISIERNEIIIDRDTIIEKEHIDEILEAEVKTILLHKLDAHTSDYAIIHNTLQKDPTNSEKEAVEHIYRQLRNAEPPDEDTARGIIDKLFFSDQRYNLGEVGRYRMNKKLDLDIEMDKQVLTKIDIITIVKYLIELINSKAEIDDIDHLSNRRVRTVGEQLSSQFGVGLARMARTIRERMNVRDNEVFTPIDLINAKTLSSVINTFFGTNQLSQFMDQTNPLAEITHKRRLSALGPGGLSRERAGFEVRDVHYTHYGRLCPIETPEGPNIGLISSLSVFAKVNNLGFIETPYRTVENGVVNTKETVYLSAEEEENKLIAQATIPLDENGKITRERVIARDQADFPVVTPEQINYTDVAPNQIASISASLIPFLEHDDANRALMGSNMMRQAVPLLRPESPIVGTGLERQVASDSRVLINAERDGVVEYVDANKIVIKYTLSELEKQISFDGDTKTYNLIKFRKTNQGTCINLKPIVRKGDKVKKGQVLSEGYATQDGELALGRNMKVAFMPWKGYNFEDAIVISEKVVREDIFTSIHIDEYSLDVRDTKLGTEELTDDIPNVSEEATKDLDENGMIRIGAEVNPGDILIGKITPKGESDPTPEEKLLRAIFGDKAGDVKDASLKAPPSLHGVVIDKKLFTRSIKDKRKRNQDKQELEALEASYEKKFKALQEVLVEKLFAILNGKTCQGVFNDLGEEVLPKGKKYTLKMLSAVEDYTHLIEGAWTTTDEINTIVADLLHNYKIKENDLQGALRRENFTISVGDELPAGIKKLAKVYIAKKRKLKVGDKMAGRHGNKGIVARIVREEEMPFLEDGTPVDIVLNPLGVPSRMNIGQIYETVLGWAGLKLGRKFATPIFDGATIGEIDALIAEANLPQFGHTHLYDGGTGERFDQAATVGVIYMLKLGHMVDDKMHSRSIGPYSLITQQPLGGKAQFGGQRFGEMEVWALEAYGASSTLQEILTVKSDDVIGRAKTYEAIVKGDTLPEPGLPESFNVLMHELKGLGLDIRLEE
ncbi:MAG: DNA-directed RNA polymerase subunit beta, partial [Flavobacteriaceae bacterium]